MYSHCCPECGFKIDDAEILLVCPDCSSDKITNNDPIEMEEN